MNIKIDLTSDSIGNLKSRIQFVFKHSNAFMKITGNNIQNVISIVEIKRSKIEARVRERERAIEK